MVTSPSRRIGISIMTSSLVSGMLGGRFAGQIQSNQGLVLFYGIHTMRALRRAKPRQAALQTWVCSLPRSHSGEITSVGAAAGAGRLDEH